MKLSIEQPKLSSALSKVLGIINKRNTVPILGNVVLSCGSGTLSVRGTDLDIDGVARTDADITEAGICTVRADMLQGIVRKLPKGTIIDLSHNDGILNIKSGRSYFNLSTLPPDDIPTMIGMCYDSEFNIAAEELLRLIDMTAFAMSNEETRYYLQGVYMHTHQGKLRFVATDGHRLSCVDSDLYVDFKGVIVPRKAILELRKILNNYDGKVSVSTSQHRVRFVTDDAELVAKVIDGTFPDYTRVIPTGHGKIAVVSASDVMTAASRAAEVATDRTRAVGVAFDSDTLTLQVKNGADVATEVIDCAYDSEAIDLGVNAKYLSECLSACGEGNVEVAMSDSQSPIVIRPEGDSSVTIVQMPMRIN